MQPDSRRADRGCRSHTTSTRGTSSANAAIPDSLLCLYRRLIALRRDNGALLEGEYFPIVTGTNVLAWRRGGDFVIAVNLGTSRAELEHDVHGTVAVCTRRAREGERVRKCIALDGGEAAVIRVS